MNLLVMALRNLWRYRRRTIISLSVIVFCVGCIVFFKAFVDGFNRTWVGNLLNLYLSHIQVHGEGFMEDEKLDIFIENYNDIELKLREVDGVEGVSPRVKTYGLLSVGEQSVGGMILGVNPENEGEVSVISDTIIKGEFLSGDGDYDIVVGERLAETLDLTLGDRLVILVQPYRGGFSVKSFYVSGIFKTHNSEIDRSFVYMDMENTTEILNYDNYINEIAVKVDDFSKATRVKGQIEERLVGLDLEVHDWKDISPDIYQMVIMMEGFVYMILFIAILAAGLGILNSIMMSALERTQEFGVMMALGTKPHRISLLIIVESLLIGLIGFIIGSVLGYLICVLVSINGIDFSTWSEALREMGAVDFKVYAIYKFDLIILALITGLGTTLLAGIYPAIRIGRLKVVTALRPIQ